VKGLRGEVNDDELEDDDGLPHRSIGRRTKNGVWNMQSAGIKSDESKVRLGVRPDKNHSKDD
jgi:hypothetical protein